MRGGFPPSRKRRGYLHRNLEAPHARELHHALGTEPNQLVSKAFAETMQHIAWPI